MDAYDLACAIIFRTSVNLARIVREKPIVSIHGKCTSSLRRATIKTGDEKHVTQQRSAITI